MKNNGILKEGEVVFYPQIGLGTVEGKNEESYIISFRDKQSRIFVPFEDVGSKKIRPLMNKAEIANLFSFFENDELKIEKDWKRRYKFHNELFLEGSPKALGLIVKNLLFIDKKKGLTKNEKRFFEKVFSLLSLEISRVLKKDVDEIKAEIKERVFRGFEEISN